MNPLLLGIGVCLFVAGIVLGRQSQFTTPPSDESLPTPTFESISSPSATMEPTSPTETRANVPTALPTSSAASNTSLTEYTYPGATILSQSTTKMSLHSNASPQTVTDWYEEKIEQQFGSKSSAKTNTNGKIKNVIAGAENNSGVRITITNDSNNSQSNIQIETTSSSDTSIKIYNSSTSE